MNECELIMEKYKLELTKTIKKMMVEMLDTEVNEFNFLPSIVLSQLSHKIESTIMDIRDSYTEFCCDYMINILNDKFYHLSFEELEFLRFDVQTIIDLGEHVVVSIIDTYNPHKSHNAVNTVIRDIMEKLSSVGVFNPKKEDYINGKRNIYTFYTLSDETKKVFSDKLKSLYLDYAKENNDE